ncbi:MAG: thioredoxin family protein [Phaeodactylibacter sp.]|nr:thioredoxin family protein [Phaeodactylibacter sp.]MCB9276786.1 thioredoxin family protein [Lewinellaceae bacterium]
MPLSLLICLQLAVLPWLTDLQQANVAAEREGKVIFLLFTGSDWCPACRRFDKNVLDTEAFRGYASRNLVLLKADFPRLRRNQLPDSLAAQNAALAERYNPEGLFPYIVLLKTGQPAWKGTYQGQTADAFIRRLEQALQP